MENRFFMTDEILKEYIVKVLCKQTIIQGGVIAVASTILAIIQYNNSNSFYAGVFLTNAIICFLAVVLTPVFALKAYKKDSLNKGYKDEIIITFADEIYLKEGDITMNIPYYKIQEIHKLNNSCVFMVSKTSGIIVKSTAFTIGSVDDCINFVSSKIKI